jgi:hypothetical protein
MERRNAGRGKVKAKKKHGESREVCGGGEEGEEEEKVEAIRTYHKRIFCPGRLNPKGELYLPKQSLKRSSKLIIQFGPRVG